MSNRGTLWQFLQKAFGWLSTPQNATEQHPIKVYSMGGGLGDELMALCALQAIHQQKQSQNFIFYSRYFSVLSGAPHVFDIRPLNDGCQLTTAKAIVYRHFQDIPILKQMVVDLGSPSASDFTLQLAPRCYPTPSAWPTEADKVILIQTTASAWTPNKQWPEAYWQSMISSLPSASTIIEVGASTVFRTPPSHPGWLSLVGKTSLEEYFACFQKASVFVGPVSSGMHLAHAFKLPSVIIVGGYEAANFPYPLAVQMGSNPQCAPCWLRTPCPFDHQCLRKIEVKQVTAEIVRQLANMD